MVEKRPYITVTLDLHDPVEIYDFIDFFASIADQYERYMRSAYPEAVPDAKIFIKEVRKGSIIADLFPDGVGSLIDYMDQVLIVSGFVALMAKSVGAYINGDRNPSAGKSELKDYLGTVRAVANDSDGKAVIETTVYKQGVLSREIAFTFSTKEAREAANSIEHHKSDLDQVQDSDHSRVLMYFKRSDSGDADLGKRSGERVVIEDLSLKDLPLIYASNLAEQRIKHEIRNSDGNVFKKGFVVDVNVKTRNGRPIAYSVTHVHQVIDLPDD